MMLLISGQAEFAFTNADGDLRIYGAVENKNVTSAHDILRLCEDCTDLELIACESLGDIHNMIDKRRNLDRTLKLFRVIIEDDYITRWDSNFIIKIFKSIERLLQHDEVHERFECLVFSRPIEINNNFKLCLDHSESLPKLSGIMSTLSTAQPFVAAVSQAFCDIENLHFEENYTRELMSDALIDCGFYRHLVISVMKNHTIDEIRNDFDSAIGGLSEYHAVVNKWINNVQIKIVGSVDIKIDLGIVGDQENIHRKIGKHHKNEQTTIAVPTLLSGIGVHSGNPSGINIRPAPANHGIAFLRTGMASGNDRLIKAHHTCVSATELCTVIGDVEMGAVATIEHLMSALYGLGVDNALIEIDSPEMPILDGSALPFVRSIDQAGIAACGAPRRWLKVLRQVRVEAGNAFAEIRPIDRGLRIDVEIDFDSPVIGRSRKAMDLSPTSYRREIAPARTFGMMKDVERYWRAGFALGASLENTVAVGETDVVNPEGLRFSDEFVRHKILDAIGDLALAGLPIQGGYRSYCGGHRLNVAMLSSLLSDRANYAIVEAGSRKAVDLDVAFDFFAGLEFPNLAELEFIKRFTIK